MMIAMGVNIASALVPVAVEDVKNVSNLAEFDEFLQVLTLVGVAPPGGDLVALPVETIPAEGGDSILPLPEEMAGIEPAVARPEGGQGVAVAAVSLRFLLPPVADAEMALPPETDGPVAVSSPEDAAPVAGGVPACAPQGPAVHIREKAAPEPWQSLLDVGMVDRATPMTAAPEPWQSLPQKAGTVDHATPMPPAPEQEERDRAETDLPPMVMPVLAAVPAVARPAVEQGARVEAAAKPGTPANPRDEPGPAAVKAAPAPVVRQVLDKAPSVSMTAGPSPEASEPPEQPIPARLAADPPPVPAKLQREMPATGQGASVPVLGDGVPVEVVPKAGPVDRVVPPENPGFEQPSVRGEERAIMDEARPEAVQKMPQNVSIMAETPDSRPKQLPAIAVPSERKGVDSRLPDAPTHGAKVEPVLPAMPPASARLPDRGAERPVAVDPFAVSAGTAPMAAALPDTLRPEAPPVPTPVMAERPLPERLPPALPTTLLHHAQAAREGPVTLVLQPEELGSLRFEVHERGAAVHILLTVERPETLDLLRRHADQLVAEFRQSGFAVATVSVTAAAQPNPPGMGFAGSGPGYGGSGGDAERGAARNWERRGEGEEPGDQGRPRRAASGGLDLRI